MLDLFGGFFDLLDTLKSLLSSKLCPLFRRFGCVVFYFSGEERRSICYTLLFVTFRCKSVADISRVGLGLV